MSDPESWFERTPLEGLAAKLKDSYYRLEHTADLFRLLTLWLFGGTYLDLDFVDIR
jgi:mannosyltransferase OCH1-like enzyme